MKMKEDIKMDVISINEEIMSKFHKLSYKKQVAILYGALDYMQQYNGRSINDCIIFAMGYIPEGYSS
jgi:hypothetical protein